MHLLCPTLSNINIKDLKDPEKDEDDGEGVFQVVVNNNRRTVKNNHADQTQQNQNYRHHNNENSNNRTNYRRNSYRNDSYNKNRGSFRGHNHQDGETSVNKYNNFRNSRNSGNRDGNNFFRRDQKYKPKR